jgi:hypothetical protein
MWKCWSHILASYISALLFWILRSGPRTCTECHIPKASNKEVLQYKHSKTKSSLITSYVYTHNCASSRPIRNKTTSQLTDPTRSRKNSRAETKYRRTSSLRNDDVACHSQPFSQSSFVLYYSPLISLSPIHLFKHGPTFCPVSHTTAKAFFGKLQTKTREKSNANI